MDRRRLMMAAPSAVLIAVIVAVLLAVRLGFVAGLPARAQQAAPASPPAPQPAPAVSSSRSDKPPASADKARDTHPESASSTQAVVVGLNMLEGVVGKAVRSATGNEDMGRIVDILVGANGDARAAVIDFGGFLGVGSRKIAVDWKTLDFAETIKGGPAKVSLNRDQVRQSPEYKLGEPVVILEGQKPNPPPASAGTPGRPDR